MPDENKKPLTILGHLDAIYHAPALIHGDMQSPFVAGLQRIWWLWGREISWRYAHSKHPNLLKLVPYTQQVAGQSPDDALESIAVLVEQSGQAIALNAVSLRPDMRRALEDAFAAFVQYRADPDRFMQPLFELQSQAENYLVWLQRELDDYQASMRGGVLSDAG